MTEVLQAELDFMRESERIWRRRTERLLAEVQRMEESLRRISVEAEVQRGMETAGEYQAGYRAGWIYAGEWADKALNGRPSMSTRADRC